MKEDSFPPSKKKRLYVIKVVLSWKNQAVQQEAEITQYEDTHKKAFFNRHRKESTRLGIKSEVAKGAIADELARFK